MKQATKLNCNNRKSSKTDKNTKRICKSNEENSEEEDAPSPSKQKEIKREHEQIQESLIEIDTKDNNTLKWEINDIRIMQ